jgi:predicted thioredoxin/glutaredoxin
MPPNGNNMKTKTKVKVKLKEFEAQTLLDFVVDAHLSKLFRVYLKAVHNVRYKKNELLTEWAAMSLHSNLIEFIKDYYLKELFLSYVAKTSLFGIENFESTKTINEIENEVITKNL